MNHVIPNIWPDMGEKNDGRNNPNGFPIGFIKLENMIKPMYLGTTVETPHQRLAAGKCPKLCT